MPNAFYDKRRIRYKLVASHEGKPYNWLFLPGGPGCDASYLQSLTDLLSLPGNSWLIDLPGNGSNQEGISGDYDFDEWFDLFLPMIEQFAHPVLVGHSFGAMLPLLFPELEKLLRGFVILNSAPSLWQTEAVEYAKRFQLPDLTEEMTAFVQNPQEQTFKRALDACMPYYFPPATLEQGRAFLNQLPFSFKPAVWWQKKALDLNYSARWIPEKVPTLIVGGVYDCIVPLSLFKKDKRFCRPHIDIVNIEKGGHCGWIDAPQEIKKIFDNFSLRLSL